MLLVSGTSLLNLKDYILSAVKVKVQALTREPNKGLYVPQLIATFITLSNNVIDFGYRLVAVNCN